MSKVFPVHLAHGEEILGVHILFDPELRPLAKLELWIEEPVVHLGVEFFSLNLRDGWDHWLVLVVALLAVGRILLNYRVLRDSVGGVLGAAVVGGAANPVVTA